MGVALLVYGRDAGVARRTCDVQTTWTGCGPGYMGNKGAVGIRFRVTDTDGGIGETYTYSPFFFFAYFSRRLNKLDQICQLSSNCVRPHVATENSRL